MAKGRDNGWKVYTHGVYDVPNHNTLSQITRFVRYIDYTFCKGIDAADYCSYRHAMEKYDQNAKIFII